MATVIRVALYFAAFIASGLALFALWALACTCFKREDWDPAEELEQLIKRDNDRHG